MKPWEETWDSDNGADRTWIVVSGALVSKIVLRKAWRHV